MTVMDTELVEDPRVTEADLWKALSDAIADLSAYVYGNDKIDTPLLKAEGLRYLTRLLASGIGMTMEGWDCHYPWLVKFVHAYMQYGIPATDCCYHWAAVHGDGVYRIRGKRKAFRRRDPHRPHRTSC
jgi:hypothetical protein